MPGMKLSVGSPSRPTPMSPVTIPPTAPSSRYSTSAAAKPGNTSAPSSSRLAGQPPAEVPEADDVVAVVLERGREEPVRPGDAPPRSVRKKKRSSVTSVLRGASRSRQSGKSSSRARGSRHRAGQDVRPDLGPLLDHADAQSRGRAPRRAGGAARPRRGPTAPPRRSPRRTPWIRVRSPPRPSFRPRSSAGRVASPLDAARTAPSGPPCRYADDYRVLNRTGTRCRRGTRLAGSGQEMALVPTSTTRTASGSCDSWEHMRSTTRSMLPTSGILVASSSFQLSQVFVEGPLGVCAAEPFRRREVGTGRQISGNGARIRLPNPNNGHERGQFEGAVGNRRTIIFCGARS